MGYWCVYMSIYTYMCSCVCIHMAVPDELTCAHGHAYLQQFLKNWHVCMCLCIHTAVPDEHMTVCVCVFIHTYGSSWWAYMYACVCIHTTDSWWTCMCACVCAHTAVPDELTYVQIFSDFQCCLVYKYLSRVGLQKFSQYFFSFSFVL